TSSQINLELYASYVYLSMTYYFDGTTSHCTTLPSFSLIIQTRRTSMQRSSLQNQRGGRIFLQDVSPGWTSTSSAHNDPHLCDFIETHYLDEQVKSIKEPTDWVTKPARHCVGAEL
uniref:Ferritin n=1 Tax=Mola mola TaxID=94237 RepID=A0A3Q3VX58_MOLML